MTEPIIESLRILRDNGALITHRMTYLRLSAIMGRANVRTRQAVMTALLNAPRTVPQAESGINALRSALIDALAVDVSGLCARAADDVIAREGARMLRIADGTICAVCGADADVNGCVAGGH